MRCVALGIFLGLAMGVASAQPPADKTSTSMPEPKPVVFAVTLPKHMAAAAQVAAPVVTPPPSVAPAPVATSSEAPLSVFKIAPSSTAAAKPLLPFEVAQGWTYNIVAFTGQIMADGLRRPALPDGMGVFAGPDKDELTLICNHEMSGGDWAKSAFGESREGLLLVSKDLLYQSQPEAALGGCTRLVVDDVTGKIKRQEMALAGTVRNCSGGVTPWGSWLSCEEVVQSADGKKPSHGWVFEVPAEHRGLVAPEPIKSMGYFYHESAACDPVAGVIYLTEDLADGLLYRFKPRVWGDLSKGGILEALAINGWYQADTRNYANAPRKIVKNQRYPIYWVQLDNVDSPKDDLRWRGWQMGAARFSRAEGVAYKNGRVVFACTNGGPLGAGQLMMLEGNNLVMIDETTQEGQGVLNPDNLTILKNGSLLVCEDRLDGNKGNRLMVRGLDGNWSMVARNNASSAEFTGVALSPDERLVFVNLQQDGKTYVLRRNE